MRLLILIPVLLLTACDFSTGACTIAPQPSVIVEVVDGDNEPLADAVVTWMPTGGNVIEDCLVRGDTFECAIQTPGAITIVVTSAGVEQVMDFDIDTDEACDNVITQSATFQFAPDSI